MVGRHRLVFLKLAWRPDSPNIPKEVDTYDELHKAEVVCIPDVVAGGDLHPAEDTGTAGQAPQGRTRNQKFVNPSKLVPRVQCYLVLETIGMPLSKYTCLYSLILAVFQAFQGSCHSYPDSLDRTTAQLICFV